MSDRQSDDTSQEHHGLGVVDTLYESFPTRFVRLVSPYALIAAAVPFLINLDYQSTDRVAQAWNLVTTQATGNSGKIEALEYLNTHSPLAIPNPRQWGLPFGPKSAPVESWVRGDDGPAVQPGTPKDWVLLKNYGPWKTRTPLVGIDVGQKKDGKTGEWLGAPTYLEDIDLRDAQLSRANFTAADLTGANLSGARMWSARLPNADLEGASLANARLRRADLSNAHLVAVNFAGATLKDADLTGADLRGAQLAEAQDVTQGQIDSTCADEKTTLPKGLRPPPLCEASVRGYLVRGLDGLPTRIK